MTLSAVLSLTLGSALLAPQLPPPPESAAIATGLPVRGVMPKAMANALPATIGQDRVVLKLAEGRPELVADGRIVAPDVLAVIGGRQVGSFFPGLAAELRAIRARQLARTPPGQRPPVDLGLYFQVHTTGGAATRELTARLNELAAVELAYPRELPTPPPGDIFPPTPDFTIQQGYRDSSPNGIDGHAIASSLGATGAGITVLDIEWGWNFDHEDIRELVASALVGPPIANPSFNNHGTAVMGEIAADYDIYGVTGFNPDVDIRVATDFPASGYSVANAIAVGLPVLTAGDVMVLEAQTGTPLGLGPTEWNQADFDAILIATGLGIVTVEAAGNGGVNLDSPSLGGLFNLNVRDSGAIIVGASLGGPLSRAGFSCYGSRIDANGWGGSVATTGYGSLFDPGDVRQRYTDSFSGTSSATPIVTGAVTAMLGAARSQLEPAAAAAMDMFAIRALLRAHGPQVSGIARRPDTAAMLAAAGLENGLTVRNEPRTGTTCFIDLDPRFPVQNGDLYAFVGSLDPDNVPMPAPFSGRYLLGTPSSPLSIGFWNGSTASETVTIPPAVAWHGTRLYLQAFVFGATSGTLTPTNGVQLIVRR